METRKFKQVPSINRIGAPNPRIPRPVILSRGNQSSSHERIIARSMHTDSRAISAGEPIDWDEVYN